VKVLDPRDPASKAGIKASIAGSIVDEVLGSTLPDVVQRVEKEYERLLAHAVIAKHVPSLTLGEVRRSVRRMAKRQRFIHA